MSEEVADTGGGEAVAAEAAPVSFLESLPEDLRNEPSLRTFTDPATLAKSYVNQQRFVGADKIPLPGKSATDDEWREVYTRLGAPTDASAYEFEGDIPLDDGYLDAFRNHALNAGLNGRQANRMMDFVRETISGMNEASAQSAEQAYEAGKQELQKEFGQAFEQRVQMAQMAATQLLGGTEVFDEITLSDGRMLGDHPEIIRMFSNIAGMIGEDNLAGATTELIMTPEEASRQIAEMTRRDGPYFDRMHPEHDTYVAEVLRLREYV
jgi:hypothetical protein